MSPEFMQFLVSGLTVGAIYALAALGFSIIYNASGAINFAQGDFLTIGGIGVVALMGAGVPLPLAVLIAVLVTAVVGVLIAKFLIAPMRGSNVASVIILTIGISFSLEGAIHVIFGKGKYSIPAFSGDRPIDVGGAAMLPQSLWVVAVAAVTVVGLWLFFERTRVGKAVLATSYNRLAAQLVGINTRMVLVVAFLLSAATSGIAGIVVSPITLTSYDAGLMYGLKGFVAATLGGLGSFGGAVAGGLLLGVFEAMAAGYISSAYKDALPFALILVILFFMPKGLFGLGVVERV